MHPHQRCSYLRIHAYPVSVCKCILEAFLVGPWMVPAPIISQPNSTAVPRSLRLALPRRRITSRESESILGAALASAAEQRIIIQCPSTARARGGAPHDVGTSPPPHGALYATPGTRSQSREGKNYQTDLRLGPALAWPWPKPAETRARAHKQLGPRCSVTCTRGRAHSLAHAQPTVTGTV